MSDLGPGLTAVVGISQFVCTCVFRQFQVLCGPAALLKVIGKAFGIDNAGGYCESARSEQRDLTIIAGCIIHIFTSQDDRGLDLERIRHISGDGGIDIGDDASAIDIGNNQVVLIAADGIWGQIMNVNPYWAGYCSVLVNVNDIAAMGGKPLAMVNIMSINHEDIYEDLLTGIKDGCLKFGVPMVGGHLHPDGDCDSVGVAIVGIAQKDKLITSFDAKTGDKVIVAIDLDGKPHEMFSLNWDTTYDKDDQLVRDQITAVQYLAEHDYIKAGKDISNPGILGTLEMLLETSGKGAVVNLEDIPRNESVEWVDWLRSYPGSGFVFTASEDKCDYIKQYLAKYSIEAEVVGDVTDTNSLYLNYGDEQAEVFNQDKNPVFIFK